ncbi:hypothetical protein [uncultured Sunxiuqinia sp.]|uniref:hypothetical protein n=1 Tax=uncultured Sunxiuqinia sp. TaxID=1573825 RepID=UPI0026087A98|nr:hypothetical protein [uncultured Sunxiuqinia sp.]
MQLVGCSMPTNSRLMTPYACPTRLNACSMRRNACLMRLNACSMSRTYVYISVCNSTPSAAIKRHQLSWH